MSALLEELTLVIGHAALQKLVERFGGRTIYPPRAGTEGGARWRVVREAIGEEAAAALVARYEYTRLYVPQDAAARRAWQEREVLRLASEGKSNAEIAERITVTIRPTERWVERVRQRAAKGAPCPA